MDSLIGRLLGDQVGPAKRPADAFSWFLVFPRTDAEVATAGAQREQAGSCRGRL
jgi:hypothetical protein